MMVGLMLEVVVLDQLLGVFTLLQAARTETTFVNDCLSVYC